MDIYIYSYRLIDILFYVFIYYVCIYLILNHLN